MTEKLQPIKSFDEWFEATHGGDWEAVTRDFTSGELANTIDSTVQVYASFVEAMLRAREQDRVL